MSITSDRIALECLDLIEQIIEQSSFKSLGDMIKKISFAQKLATGQKDIKNKKMRFITKNIIMKVQMSILEALEDFEIEINQDNYLQVLSQKSRNNKETEEQLEIIRCCLLEQIERMKEETETSLDKMLKSSQLIKNNEIIMISDYSPLVVEYLVKMVQKEQLLVEVMLVENAIDKEKTLQVLQILSQQAIQTTIIPETSIFAIMNRVNKVIIQPFSIMNNGGVISESNGLLLATAAKNFQVPFIVLSEIYKLTPKFPLDQQTFNQQINPSKVLGLDHSTLFQHNRNLNILADQYNYIEPMFITLFITPFGENTPQHVYSLFDDYYGKEVYRNLLSQYKKET